MDIGVISVRYARALLKSATMQGVHSDVYSDMQKVAEVFLNVPKLKRAFENPMLSAAKKEELLCTAIGQSPIDLTRKFIKLVLKEGREEFFLFMANSYISQYRKQQNLISGKLITASSISSETEERLRQMVESRTKGNVEFQMEVNPDIIGGFILEYDTYRMDASVKSQLRKILNTLS